MEKFYFRLSEDAQQTVDVVFVGGVLRNSYNQTKTMLDTMISNSQECRDDCISSKQENGENRGRTDEGMDRNAMVTLQGQVTEMNKLLSPWCYQK